MTPNIWTHNGVQERQKRHKPESCERPRVMVINKGDVDSPGTATVHSAVRRYVDLRPIVARDQRCDESWDLLSRGSTLCLATVRNKGDLFVGCSLLDTSDRFLSASKPLPQVCGTSNHCLQALIVYLHCSLASFNLNSQGGEGWR